MDWGLLRAGGRGAGRPARGLPRRRVARRPRAARTPTTWRCARRRTLVWLGRAHRRRGGADHPRVRRRAGAVRAPARSTTRARPIGSSSTRDSGERRSPPTCPASRTWERAVGRARRGGVGARAARARGCAGAAGPRAARLGGCPDRVPARTARCGTDWRSWVSCSAARGSPSSAQLWSSQVFSARAARWSRAPDPRVERAVARYPAGAGTGRFVRAGMPAAKPNRSSPPAEPDRRARRRTAATRARYGRAPWTEARRAPSGCRGSAGRSGRRSGRSGGQP